MKALLRKWWPLLAWAALIALSSSTFISSKDFVRWMSDHSPWQFTEAEFGAFWSRWWWVFVKGYHLLEFTVLFLLVYVSVRRTRLQPVQTLAVSYVATAVYSALDEWHQSFVPLRGGRVTDVLIDMAGATLLAAFLGLRTAEKMQNGGGL